MYSHSDGVPVTGSRGVSSSMRAEFDLIQTGFDIAQNYYVDTGTANSIAITPSTGIASLADGLRFWIKAAAATTGATTVNMGAALGTAIPLKRMDGSAISTDILAGDLFLCIYKASTSALHLVGVSKNYVDQLAFGTALPNQTGNSGKFVTTDGTNAGWASPYPNQTGNSGKFLKTNGTAASWDYDGISTVGSTVTDNYTITGTTPTIYPTITTAIGKSLTAPDATTLAKGLNYVIDNKAGGYPVGYLDSAGTLIAAVAVGGIAQVYLEDNSTAAGTWRVVGTNLEPGLITIDSTFSGTYASTVLAPFVALDSNTSIHFASLASGNGFSAFIVDNTGKAVGTPVTVTTFASSFPLNVFKVSATSAIVFSNEAKAYVLTVSGATISVGAGVSVPNLSTVSNDFTGPPKIAQLSPTLYLASYVPGANTSVTAISVSGTTVTVGAAADIIASSSVANSTTTYALTATTALVLYKSSAGSAPYQNNAVVVSVSGTTCTKGIAAAANLSSHSLAASSVMLSATKILVFDDNNDAAGTSVVTALTVSGTTVTAGAGLTVETGIAGWGAGGNYQGFSASNATRYNPHLFALSANTALLWYLDSNGISRAVVLSESAGTVTAGTILYRSICSGSANSAGFGGILPQGTTEFLSVVERTANTAGYFNFLSAHKINGTSITQGQAREIIPAIPNTTSTIGCTRLSSGKYVLINSTNQFQQIAAPVFSSNGDAISYLGAISLPAMGNNTASSSAIPIAVSANRLVYLAATWVGTTVGASTYQLRLLNIEVCA